MKSSPVATWSKTPGLVRYPGPSFAISSSVHAGDVGRAEAPVMHPTATPGRARSHWSRRPPSGCRSRPRRDPFSHARGTGCRPRCRAQPVEGDLAGGRGDVQQRTGVRHDILAEHLELVGTIAKHAIEDLERDRHEVRVRDPRAVVALRGLALLVLTDLRQRGRVDLRVAARGMNAAIPPIACAPRRWQVATSSSA